jgi:hypothetical protein
MQEEMEAKMSKNEGKMKAVRKKWGPNELQVEDILVSLDQTRNIQDETEAAKTRTRGQDSRSCRLKTARWEFKIQLVEVEAKGKSSTTKE